MTLEDMIMSELGHDKIDLQFIVRSLFAQRDIDYAEFNCDDEDIII